jgi:hypothetical protein
MERQYDRRGRNVCRAAVSAALRLGGKRAGKLELGADRREPVAERPRPIENRFQDLTIVTCATSIAPPRNPPSQYMR